MMSVRLSPNNVERSQFPHAIESLWKCPGIGVLNRHDPSRAGKTIGEKGPALQQKVSLSFDDVCVISLRPELDEHIAATEFDGGDLERNLHLGIDDEYFVDVRRTEALD